MATCCDACLCAIYLSDKLLVIYMLSVSSPS